MCWVRKGPVGRTQGTAGRLIWGRAQRSVSCGASGSAGVKGCRHGRGENERPMAWP